MTPHPDATPALNRAGRRLESKKARKLAALGSGLVLASSGAATVAMATGSQVAGASTLTVENLNATGADSLHDLVEGASAGDVIVFNPTLAGEITLTDDIDVPASVTIEGPGRDVITVSGNDSVRIFTLSAIAPTPATFTVSGLTLAEGSVSGDGGAIYADDAVDITLRDARVTDNAASDNGGAIYSDDDGASVHIIDSEVSGNRSVDGGGAIWFSHGDVFESVNSTFSGNTATNDDGWGGAAYVYDLTTAVIITDSQFTDNTAYGSGGAITSWNQEIPFTITGSTFSGNRAGYNGDSDRDGGALYLVYSEVTISGSTFTDNSAPNMGGAIGANKLAVFNMESSTVSGNETGQHGGGIWFYAAETTPTIESSTISDNSAGFDGGGIAVDVAEGFALENSTVSGNSAAEGGGGVYAWGVTGEVSITNSTISGNTADDGGGIHFSSYYGLSVVQSTITGNQATTIGGIKLENIDLGSVDAATSRGNGGSGRPGAGGADTGGTDAVAPGALGITFDDSHVDLVGTILWGNTNGDLGTEGSATSDHSLLGTVVGTALTDAGGTLTDVDPKLGPLQNNGGPTATHALLDGSPAINAGPDPLPDFPLNSDDQRGPGYPRVVGGTVDIGAFEVQPVSIEPTFTG